MHAMDPNFMPKKGVKKFMEAEEMPIFQYRKLQQKKMDAEEDKL